MSCLGVTEGAPTRGGKGSPVPPSLELGQLARETSCPTQTNGVGGGRGLSPFAESIPFPPPFLLLDHVEVIPNGGINTPTNYHRPQKVGPGVKLLRPEKKLSLKD